MMRHIQIRRMARRSSASNFEKLKLLKSLYMSEGRFSSPSDLANVLFQNVVYYAPKKIGEECSLGRPINGHRDNSGLLVVNKPAGVPLKTTGEGHIGLNDALPTLAEMLGVKKIECFKSVQRYASGCVLLCTKEQAKHQLRKSFNRCDNRYFKESQTFERVFGETYFALTDGVPRLSSTSETVDMTWENIRDDKNQLAKNNKRKEPVINRILASKTQFSAKRTTLRKDGELWRYSVNSNVLSKSIDGKSALFSIEPNSTKWNFLTVYAADMLSPVIGDQLYSYRVKNFMNKKIRVKTSHAPDSNASPNHLPEWLLKKLGLKPEEEGILPLHLHLGRIYLPGYFGEKNDLCITSAPRPYFMGTAELLGIDLPEECFEDYEPHTEQKKRQTFRQKQHQMEIMDPESGDFVPMDGKNYLKFSEDTLQK